MNCECAVTTCKFNEQTTNKYGQCRHPKGITLKFRLAGDFGKGTIVMLECMQQTLPQDEEET